MAVSLIITDGGVSGLLAIAAHAERSSAESLTLYWNPGLLSGHRESERAACRIQGQLYGISEPPEQTPFSWPESQDQFERTSRILLEAALMARRLGGGEVVWPVTATMAANGGPDVDSVSRAINQALLVSQLVSLTAPKVGGIEELRVRIRTPYVDLVDRQIADLILDMDLPIWTCWFWNVGDDAEEDLRASAAAERTRWTVVLREAGWTGSLDPAGPTSHPHIVTLPQEAAKPAPRASGESR